MKKRAALINYFNRLKREFPLEFSQVDTTGVEVYIEVEDRKNRIEIVAILREHRKRIPIKAITLLENRHDSDHYAKEPYGTMAIKFKHGQLNARIYCLEFRGPYGRRRVVMVFGIRNKADQAVKQTIKSKLKAISHYQYEFFKTPHDAIKHRQSSSPGFQ